MLSVFNREVARHLREKHWAKSYQMRKEDEINAIVNALHDVSGRVIVGMEGTNGRGVCLEAWRVIYGKGRSQFYELKKMVRAGANMCIHGNLGKRRMSDSVSQSLMSMKGIIDECADNHPAKLRTMNDNTRQVLRELPIGLNWENLRKKVNSTNEELGVGKISQPTMSVLRSNYVKEVGIKKKGSNFSKCTTCCELSERKSKMTGGREERELLRADEDRHHKDHTEGRMLYHAWRFESIHRPKEVLCMIHDKMDHCKTALPRMPRCPKSLDGVQRVPVTLTGILTHGHGPKAIAQYNVGVWPADPNACIGSLDSILRMLENPKPTVKSLLEGPDTTELFSNMLFGRIPVLGDMVQNAFKEDLNYISNLGEKNYNPIILLKYTCSYC